MGVIQHSTSKKIDVDDLKKKLAESVRSTKYNQPYSATSAAETLKKANKSGRSKSPIGHQASYGNVSRSNSDAFGGENSSTIKMYNDEDPTPAWYKTLKKNVK